MRRGWIITIIIWFAIISIGSWAYNAIHDYMKKKDLVEVSYSDALALLNNESLIEVEINSFSSATGYDVLFRMKDGKVFFAYTADPQLHQRVFKNKEITVKESRIKESASILQSIISLVLVIGMVLAVSYVFRDTQRKKDQDRLRNL